ncbi:uncharacterized protein F4822DRAFT_413027 [Hypoxylon trugodes]|uniref:uncharacterized protein n=1 Tax=Hypoxylon trugodes TaxID=326681 RepID=UPI0021A1393A|nr:uncharacterized protein F4822DRAFT_413027 [Hypoxylon trugodes]KAI1385437.1 hypothetical protein F4822DRAFT_413027 [Hypoxylon trugodes]
MASGLPIALLIIYITVSLPTIYIAFKHGVRHAAIIGWGFLFIFCTLRIISSAIESKDSTSTGAALIASIGLSPLLASVCGVLHEARAYLIPKSRRPADVTFLVFFHFLVTTAIALVAAGASKLDNTTLPPDQMKRSHNLVKAGMVMLLLSWISLALLVFNTFYQSLAQRASKVGGSGGTKLLLAVTFSIPFLGIRVLERLIYFFTENQALNPVTGSLGLRVGLEVIEELIVTFMLLVAGIMTRNIKSAPTEAIY